MCLSPGNHGDSSYFKFLHSNINNPYIQYVIADKGYIKNTIAKFNLKFADIGKPLRVIVSGNTNNADLAASLEFLGKEQTRVRIGNAINLAVINCK